MLVDVTPGTLLLLLLLEPQPATTAASAQMAPTANILWLFCLILYLLLVVDACKAFVKRFAFPPPFCRSRQSSTPAPGPQEAHARGDRAHSGLNAARPQEHRGDQHKTVDRERQIVGDVRRQ